MIHNIYRPPTEPDTGAVLRFITGIATQGPMLVAGDFNTSSALWDLASDGHQSSGAGAINIWIEEQCLTLVTPPDEPPHQGGQTLNIAESNVPGAISNIQKQLHTSSAKKYI